MTTIRVSKSDSPFVQIHKGFLSDNRLTWKAKGLLAYLLSKPDGWVVAIKDLQNQSKDGREAVQTGLKELESTGYLERSKHRRADGTFYWGSVILEAPIAAFAEPDQVEIVEQVRSDRASFAVKPQRENRSRKTRSSNNNEYSGVANLKKATPQKQKPKRSAAQPSVDNRVFTMPSGIDLQYKWVNPVYLKYLELGYEPQVKEETTEQYGYTPAYYDPLDQRWTFIDYSWQSDWRKDMSDYEWEETHLYRLQKWVREHLAGIQQPA